METKAEIFIKEGKLKEGEVELEQIEGLLREAVIDLDEAQKTHEIAAYRATFFLSYMSMLRAGRALLLLQGYCPTNCSQHQTIVEMTGAILGEGCRNVTQHFEQTQIKQDEMVHHSDTILSELEAHDAFHYALLLIREVVKIVKKKDSDFHVTVSL